MVVGLIRYIVRTALVTAIAVTAYVPLHGSTAQAASAGITVTPAQLQFGLSKDAPSQRTTVTLTNTYDTAITMAAEIKATDEDNGILVPTDATKPLLASLIKLSETNIQLLPHQAHQITVQLDNSPSLPAGGSYASLVLTQVGAASGGLSLRAAMSLTIFAVKTEGSTQSLALTSTKGNGWLFALPTHVTLQYTNTGNVHVVPRATIAIAKAGHDVPLKQGVSNNNSVIILPFETWSDTVALRTLGHTWRPGKIQLAVAYRADGAADAQLVLQDYWYVPPVYPLVLLTILGYIAQRKRWHVRIRSYALGKNWSGLRPKWAQPRSAISAASIDQPGVETDPERTALLSEEPPEEPRLTLAALEQRTTKVAPKKPKTTLKPKAAKKKTTPKKAGSSSPKKATKKSATAQSSHAKTTKPSSKRA